MKYNKDKQKSLKKFATGGKTPAQIMEEARRNQAIWKQQQEEDISAAIARDAANTAARDAVNNSGIPAYQSPPVSIQDPRSLVLDKINPDRRTYTMGNSNLSEVVILGKGPRRKQRPAPTVTPYTDKYGFPLTRPVTDRDGNIIQGPAAESITNREQGSVPEQRTNREQHAIDVSRLPKISWDEKVGWTVFGVDPGKRSIDLGQSVDEDGDKNWQYNRFVTPDGKDHTYAYGKNFIPLVERTIHEGDTTHRRHNTLGFPTDRELDLYKRIFADGDEKYLESMGPHTNNSATQSSPNWWERLNENNAARRERARNRSSRGVPEVLQRAGTVANKLSMRYQQGGQLPLRNGLEKFFRIEPRYTSVDSTSLTPTESVTDYMDNTLRGPQRVSKIRKPVDYGSGYLTSTRVIRNPWTDKADTTYIAPTGARFGPSRVIEAPYLQSYPDKFGKYFKYQQGGKVESPSDEMYVDFAVRYLSALGVGETEMVDEEGGLREEYAEAVTVALQEIDSPEFWEHYHSNPDEAVGAYVESKQSPEQVEMAKKGAKLKMLKKAKGGKVKKCKCGCGMTMKKEKGGKLTEVCSCGCKN